MKHGTMVRIAETVSPLTDLKSHQTAVDEEVAHGLRGGLSVHSATSFASTVVTPEGPMTHRVTTIVMGA